MANTKYYFAANYKHHIFGILPNNEKIGEFPICPWCGADIYADDINKEWACSNTGCRLR